MFHKYRKRKIHTFIHVIKSERFYTNELLNGKPSTLLLVLLSSDN